MKSLRNFARVLTLSMCLAGCVTQPFAKLTIRAPGQPSYSTKWPHNADGSLMSGTTIVLALVDRQGRTADVKVEVSSGYDALDAAVVAAIKQWKFTPDFRNGAPVESYRRIPVAIDPTGSGVGQQEWASARTTLPAPHAAWGQIVPAKASDGGQ